MTHSHRLYWLKLALALLALLAVATVWWLNHPVQPQVPETLSNRDFLPTSLLMFEFPVPKIGQWDFLETRWLYVGLLAFTLSFPLVASFERRWFHFYGNWRHFFPGNLLVAALFIAWDAYFTHIGVWGFNDDYLSGGRLLLLPWEEWLFFLIVPFSCTFIYESLNYFVKRDWLGPFERGITLGLIGLFFLVGCWMWQHIYTATTFLLCGFLTLYHFLFVEGSYRGRFYLAYLVTWLPFLLVNGILTGGLTQEPVVMYDRDEYCGLRIGSVPVDDSAYSFLLLLGNISMYEWLKKRRPL